jgi:hypothetical protein
VGSRFRLGLLSRHASRQLPLRAARPPSMLEMRATSEGWRPVTRVTRMACLVDRCIREVRLRVRRRGSRTLIWSRGEGRPYEKKNKMLDTMSKGAVPQKKLLHSASELPSGSWVEKDFAKPTLFCFSLAALRPGLVLRMLADSSFRGAPLSITIPFPGLSRHLYVVARRTCFRMLLCPLLRGPKMYVVAP